MKSGYEDHRDRVSKEGPRSIPCAVLTVSDTRTLETDKSGDRIVASLERDGHRIALRDIITDDAARIAPAIERAVDAAPRS